jgi:hypothetical protein
MAVTSGLSRHLLAMSEIVIEVDRPKRAARRNGAKSDPLDAIRAAREAMGRPRVGTPRTGGERQALSVLLAARRSAVNASTEAQQQVFSLVIAAPEPIRDRFRGQKLAVMLTTAANLRVHASWDTETTSTVVALRTLARRAHAMASTMLSAASIRGQTAHRVLHRMRLFLGHRGRGWEVRVGKAAGHRDEGSGLPVDRDGLGGVAEQEVVELLSRRDRGGYADANAVQVVSVGRGLFGHHAR